MKARIIVVIMLVGGGSGGHITPLLAVASRLKYQNPKLKITLVSERRGNFKHLFEDANDIDSLVFINAGKYRRYHGVSRINKILDFKTIFLNIIDIAKLSIGVVESFFILRSEKPDVIFIKGGFVGVPIGVAARLLKIPYITHDSDAVPGLTNKIIGKKATINSVAMPEEHYSYPENKVVTVGVPVADDFKEFNEAIRLKKRHELDIDKDEKLILITGGSNGAQNLDKIVHAIAQDLMKQNSNLRIVHQVGKGNEKIYEDYPAHLHSKIRVASFLKPLSKYIAASDIVIARAGATAIAEIGHMGKPLIVIPSPYLSGGHQLANADILEKSEAAIIIDEHDALKDKSKLEKAVIELLRSSTRRHELSKNLLAFTQTDATGKICDMLIKTAKNKN